LFRNLKLPREVLVQLLHRSAASSSFRMTDCWKINGCPWHPVWMTRWKGVPTLKFMIHQSALGNALEKCNP
jgi:hypothetical protein